MSARPFIFNHLLDHRGRDQLARMDDDARRALLLELLARGQSEQTWLAVCELFASWPEGEAKAKSIADADRALETWDDRTRHLTTSWGYFYEGDKPSSVVRLARSVELYRREEDGSADLRRIAGSELFSGLKRLKVLRCVLSPKAVEAFAASPHLTSLLHLAFVTTLFSEERFGKLFTATAFPNLQTLILNGAGIDAGWLNLVPRSIPFGRLERLDLSRNYLRSEGLAILSQAPWLGSIRTLELKDNDIRDEGVNAFVRSTNVGRLKLLDLSGNLLTEAGKKPLLAMSNEKGFSLIL